MSSIHVSWVDIIVCLGMERVISGYLRYGVIFGHVHWYHAISGGMDKIPRLCVPRNEEQVSLHKELKSCLREIMLCGLPKIDDRSMTPW